MSKPNDIQRAVIGYYGGLLTVQQVAEYRADSWARSAQACKRRGWIEDTDSPPLYARATQAGLTAYDAD